MGAFTKIVDWAGDHPVLIGVGVFAIGGLVLLSLNKGGGDGSGMTSFYAAQAAQNASNNSVALAQVQGATATGIAKIAAGQNVTIADTQARVALAQTDAATSLGLARNTTAQQGQKQQFFLDVGEQQIEGAIAPYILGRPDLASILDSFNRAGTGYNAAH
jgi:hypothetical protein